MTYFPDGFPCVSFLPQSLGILEPERKNRQTCVTPKKEGTWEPGGPQQKAKDETGKRLEVREAGEGERATGRLFLATQKIHGNLPVQNAWLPEQRLPRRPLPGFWVQS